MKGVSEVIAIILILMIVIALAALAYTWFSGIFASMTGAAGTAVTSTTQAMATQFRIESARYTGSNLWNVNVTVRNFGTQSFDLGKSVAYIAIMAPKMGPPSPTILAANGGTGVIYNISAATGVVITCGVTTVTVTIETGLTDTRVISC